ncbi:MAG: hypothetical protein M3Z20_12015 [Chloroflexota bacterium]|nr:hypothetical protein [Chloroflexota bacterium]
MANITVAALIIETHTEDHIWERHRIADVQVYALIEGRYKVIPNHGTAPYRLIGHDYQGRCLAAPIAPTYDPLVWTVASAWYCDKEEQMILMRR